VLLEAQGFVTLFDLSALDLPSSQLAVAVQRGFASAERPILQRYVDAVIEAGTLQRQDRAFAIEVLKKYLRVDDEAALGVAYEYYTTRVLPRLPYPRPEQLADALEQLAEKNERARDYDVAALLDPSFVQSAADRGLGRQ
jgi:ABC-type nitrate/sulfonate/bicarbonate transport system substrate-binding protein